MLLLLYYYYHYHHHYFSFLHWQIFFTHKASHNKWTKAYGFIVHLLSFQKPASSYFFTFFLTCSVFGTMSLPLPTCHFLKIFCLFSSPNPVSTNLIGNLRSSLINELSLSSGVFCSKPVLEQLSVLLCISSCSLMCYQVPLLPLE